MKKIFFSALAALSLVACVQEAIVDTPQGEAIAFENAFVDNATRADASLTANNLTAFKVYGIVNNTSGVVFDGTVVSKIDGDWKYDGVKYWIPGQDYYFAALAPVTNNWSLDKTDATVAGPGVLTFTNIGTEDLIYAKAAQEGKESGRNPAVAFTFQHLLSKVKFSFTEGFEEEYINVNVKDITLNAPATASLDLTATPLDWDNYAASAPYVYGNLSSLTAEAKSTSDFFIIPGYDAYTINFNVEVWQEGVETKKQEFSKTASIQGLTFEIGKAYNLTALISPETLALETIEFKVDQVEDWSNGGSTQIFPATPVNDTPELIAAINAGENVILTGDIDLNDPTTKASPTIGLTISKDIILDGNGHTIKSNHGRAINIDGANDVTIRNVNIVAKGERAINIINGTKKVNIDNVTATAANYTVNVAGSAPEAQVKITGSDLIGLNTVNIAGTNSKVEITDTKITCDDNTTAENYAALTIHMDGKNAEINMASGEIVINGDSYAGSAGGLNSQITIADNVNITGSTQITTINYFIDYGINQYAFQTFAEALAKVNNGETIKINRDVNETIEVTSDKTFTLDLNGKNITATGDAIVVNNGATVTINGAGSNVTASSEDNASACAVWVPYGNVTINGGNYYVGSDNGNRNDCIYVGSSANKANAADYKSSVVINSGRFAAEAGDATQAYWVLNLQDAFYKAESTITVYGGEFVGFNPADNKSEGANTNFVAPGYEAVENNGVWTVGAKLIDTAEEFIAEIENKASDIVLAAGATIDINDRIVYINHEVNISSPANNKATLKGKFVANSDITVTNVKFGANAKTAFNLDQGIYGTYVVDNYSAIITLNYSAGTFNYCEFDGKLDAETEFVAINYFQDAAGKVLNVTNCKFTDTFIYSKVLCNIDSNTFNCGDYIPYPICVWPRPAGSTNSICYFVNNTVSSNYYKDEHKGHCLVMLLSQSTPYANLEFNVQGNSEGATKYTWGWTNSATCAKDGSITFASGSKTFNLF